MIKVCLFDAKELSLKDPMRSGASDSEMYDLISSALGDKKFSHLGMDNIANTNNRPMIKIGG